MQKMITVDRWINWEEAQNLEESFDGLGGFFQNGMRWRDYLARFRDDVHVYAEALRAAVIKDGIRATGEEHQNGELVPVFNDGTCAMFSYRAWGDIMAAIWSEEDNKDYNYIDFY